jgi:predicted small secreted protein
MTAKEARELSEKSHKENEKIDKMLSFIYKEIEETAKKGLCAITITIHQFQNMSGSQIDKIFDTLENLGYKIEEKYDLVYEPGITGYIISW